MEEQQNVPESIENDMEVRPQADPEALPQTEIQNSSFDQPNNEPSLAILEAKTDELILGQLEQNQLLVDQNSLLIFLIGVICGVTFMVQMLKGWYRA